MSTHSLPSQTFPRRRARNLSAAVRQLLAGWWKALWSRCNDDPATALQNLRADAASLMDRDPRFAAELFAAADRHERLHEV